MAEVDEVRQGLTSVGSKKYNCNPYSLSFRNLTCKVISKKREKTLLDDASGLFKPGRLTAILGPSGAGKSTLLNILAGNKTKGVTGQVLINGKTRSNEDRWNLCLISQETTMLSLLTTKETLRVAADLKMPSNTAGYKKEKIISDIADILNLQKSMDTKVGKLSGGEIKRLSIGIELVTNPPIMLVDEPTSGLDSVSSVQIVTHLKNLAEGGRTIVCVIHQPSSKIFDMFDDMILVSEGKIIYGGPVANMVSTFQTAGFICPQYYNRADFAIEVASLELDGNIASLAAKSNLSESDSGLSNWTGDNSSDKEMIKIENNDSALNFEENSQELNLFSEDNDNGDTKICLEDSPLPSLERTKSDYPISQLSQFFILLQRSTKCTFRDLMLAYMRISTHLVVGICLGLVYYNFGNDGAKTQSNCAFLFFILLFLYFSNAMPTVLVYPLEASVFQRERLNHWYSLPAYYFSKMLSDLPLQILCPTLFLLVSYYMTDQPFDLWRLGMVWFICFVFTIISQACGLICGVSFSPSMALFVLPALTIPMLMFSGFFIKFDELPQYLRGASYISFFGYGFEAIAQVIYGYNRPTLNCSEDYCYLVNPKKIMKTLSPRVSLEYDIYILFGVAILLYCILYAVLVWRVWRSKQ